MNRFDFVMYFLVDFANPNGDPTDNSPRQLSDGTGVMTPVCIKRKMRNAMQDHGANIFMQSDGREQDEFRSAQDRANAFYAQNCTCMSLDEVKTAVLNEWIDVRCFGQVFAFNKKNSGNDVIPSLNITGAVTVTFAKSVVPVEVERFGISRSLNGMHADEGVKSPDTLGGEIAVVKHGLYVVKGTVCPHAAKKNGLNDKDIEYIKQSLLTIFDNDASAARPAGSMSVVKLYWCETQPGTAVTSRDVFNSICANVKDASSEPNVLDDYEFTVHPIDGVDVKELK